MIRLASLFAVVVAAGLAVGCGGQSTYPSGPLPTSLKPSLGGGPGLNQGEGIGGKPLPRPNQPPTVNKNNKK